MKATPREAQALDFIRYYYREFGCAPYQHQIAARFGTDSRGFVCRMLSSMERKGLIARRWGSIRSIVLTDQRAAS